MRSRRAPHVAALLVGCGIVVACATPADIAVERSDRVAVPLPGVDDPIFSDSDDPSIADAPGEVPTTVDTGDPIEQDPTETTDPTDPPATVPADPVVTDPDAIDFGDEKPVRDRDDFLLAAFTDIEAWLAEEFEPAFGIPFEPLRGEVYAGYPERTDPIPACGTGQDTTSYRELSQFVAFYCPIGDFIAYDDGDGGLLDQLADEFGAATIGVVLAHEYGHALQLRSGALDLRLPTVVTEQQADCVPGAWAGRAAGGQAPGVPFGEPDVRASLIAMIQVQDPIGTNPVAAGGHGSGFDRVGAFQTGFTQGLARCAQLIDDPLPLTPLNFLSQEDLVSGGNADFGFDDGDLFDFLPLDLDLYFGEDLAGRFPGFEPLALVPTQSESEVSCAQPFGDYANGVVLCHASATVFLNVPELARLYDEFGDFGPGYLLGRAWAESAQRSVESELTGEDRELFNDCLIGAWVRSATPQLDGNGNFVFDEAGDLVLLEPRSVDRQALLSPNDLTEAIQTAILIGDPTAATDRLGSAFEKIDAFRTGTLNGLDACS